MKAGITRPSAIIGRARREAFQPIVLPQKRAVKDWGFGEEPSVAEMIADPVMQRLMARDGVATDALLTLLSEMRQRLGLDVRT